MKISTVRKNPQSPEIYYLLLLGVFIAAASDRAAVQHAEAADIPNST